VHGTFEIEERLLGRGGEEALTLDPSPIGWARETACGSQVGFQVAGVAPGESFEAEVENTVQFIKGDAHVETLFYGGEARAAGFLHDGKRIGVEPADGARVEGFDGFFFFG